jgi:hypothetical protein
MKTQGAAIQGSLAALGLLAAYATWQKEPDRPPGEVVVLDVNPKDLSKVRYEDGTGKWVEMERRTEAGEPVVWLKVSARPELKAPERELRGAESAGKLWERLAPLRASRALGVMDAAKLKEVGLEAPKKRLELTARGEKAVFLFGTSPFGVSQPYVKSERDGKVYVLEGGVTSELDSASSRLVDRTLHPWKAQDYDALVVSANGKKRELLQLHPENPAATKLASKATQKPDDLAKNWHDKVWRIMVLDVLGKHETPQNGAPQVALRIDYKSHGKDKGFLEVGRVTPPPPTTSTSAAPPPPELYARSESTAGWVKIAATAEDLLKEAEKVAAGD